MEITFTQKYYESQQLSEFNSTINCEIGLVVFTYLLSLSGIQIIVSTIRELILPCKKHLVWQAINHVDIWHEVKQHKIYHKQNVSENQQVGVGHGTTKVCVLYFVNWFAQNIEITSFHVIA